MQPTHPENPGISRQHDPLDVSDAEAEADIQGQVVAGEVDAGDGEAARERRELDLDPGEDSGA